ncbi:splicing factor U2af large subunit, partial [Globisporangium polare]
MEHSKGDGAGQIVVHKDYDDDSDYSNDCEDDNRMETDDDDPRAGQIVVHGLKAGTSTEVTCTSFEPGDGHEYDASVEQILVEFRRQAHALMGAQIQLHNRQTVNQEQVLSIFQFFSEAQVAIQQQNEFRLQSALADSQAQAAA